VFRKKKIATYRSRLTEECIHKSWWVILFFLLCLFAYDHAMEKRREEEEILRKKLASLQKESKVASDERDYLLRQIDSQSDPFWIELTLMKGLGLVPEGQKKILFTKKEYP